MDKTEVTLSKFKVEEVRMKTLNINIIRPNLR